MQFIRTAAFNLHQSYDSSVLFCTAGTAGWWFNASGGP